MAAFLAAVRSLPRVLLSIAALVGLLPGCGLQSDDADDDRPVVAPFPWDDVAKQPRGPRPYFSFFVTTEQGLLSLPAGRWSPAPDPVTGFGGNLGGLRGADEICTMLAQKSNPGDTKLWRAFLSTTGEVDGGREDAIDRIGQGPWYDFRGYKLADDLAGLLPLDPKQGRPRGCDPLLADMFTGENGEEIGGGGVDNHDVLTGSGLEGRLFDDQAGGRVATCADWTSVDLRGLPGGLMATGGQVPVGHSWPRSNIQGRHWISEHTVNGCERGGRTNGGTSAPVNDFRVGGAGGYGGFYCFALNALPFQEPPAAAR